MAALVLEGVTRSYGGFTALAGVDLTVAAGATEATGDRVDDGIAGAEKSVGRGRGCPRDDGLVSRSASEQIRLE